MTDEMEGNLNLIQLQGMVEIDTIKVANIFIKCGKRLSLVFTPKKRKSMHK